jgi:CRISPR-associated protein Csm5
VKYQVTCLTPTLVGDGRKLAPIDYMVWKDAVNVLDQTRIFRLLSKGPRLESYLAQLKKATKLDFASWGGFAQNYAERRVPFEHASLTALFEKAPPELLFIPTFASGASGPYLPGTAIKGSLRTGALVSGWKESTTNELAARFTGERPPRRPAIAVEEQVLGAGGSDRMRYASVADSRPVANDAFQIHLLRVATLQAKPAGGYSLAWKQSPRGNAARAEDGTPAFAEMAVRGTSFEGAWSEKTYLDGPEVRKALRWNQPATRERLFRAANDYAARMLDLHQTYAESAGLAQLTAGIAELRKSLEEARNQRNQQSCLLSIGWGAGFLGKSALLDTANAEFRKVLQSQTMFQRAIQSGLPFPKTRRIVFQSNVPAQLPGWVKLQVVD